MFKQYQHNYITTSASVARFHTRFSLGALPFREGVGVRPTEIKVVVTRLNKTTKHEATHKQTIFWHCMC